MTYNQLFALKYREGLSTCELIHRYPTCADKVKKVALCDVPTEMLREIMHEESEFLKLMKLKKRFSKWIGT